MSVDIRDLNAQWVWPRRSRALLNDEQQHGVTVVSRVREVRIREGLVHRTVLVQVDGESKPRPIELTRLAEFSRMESP